MLELCPAPLWNPVSGVELRASSIDCGATGLLASAAATATVIAVLFDATVAGGTWALVVFVTGACHVYLPCCATVSFSVLATCARTNAMRRASCALASAWSDAFTAAKPFVAAAV